MAVNAHQRASGEKCKQAAKAKEQARIGRAVASMRYIMARVKKRYCDVERGATREARPENAHHQEKNNVRERWRGEYITTRSGSNLALSQEHRYSAAPRVAPGTRYSGNTAVGAARRTGNVEGIAKPKKHTGEGQQVAAVTDETAVLAVRAGERIMERRRRNIEL